MTTTQSLPHWDMTVVYPGLESPEFAQGFAQITQSIIDLTALFDTHQIVEQPTSVVDNTIIQTFEMVLQDINSVLTQNSTLTAYIACFVTTNSQDDIAQAKLSELEQLQVKLSHLNTRFTAWLGSLDIEELIKRSLIAQEHAYMLREAKVQATHLMTPGEEVLAAELDVSGGAAWSKLHSNLTSQFTVPLKLDGKEQQLPMSVLRNLAFDANREVRRQAYEAELAGWKQIALPLAAAMNGIKGEVNTLATHRKWRSPLEASLSTNSIDQQTLDAMLTAARETFPDLRRYLHIKAQTMGLERLTWYDLFAPLNTHGKVWSFDEAADFIIEQFGSYSPRLSDFAARAFREHWIDAEPRPGKVGGAFCISLRGEESRVLTNYKPVYEGVSTLAHELGHGYHNLNLAGRTALQQTLPMTLAETASIFCETIIRQAVLRKANKQEQIAILEASLQDASQLIIDISSRFLFEQRVFEKRKQRDLSVEELNSLMIEAQMETYGEGVDKTVLHPYMWAVKPHYYSSAESFYNYPYMFGLLFGLGLYAQYQQDPERFKTSYDELLSSTGLADAATLAAHFGIDLHTEAFWRSSLDLIRNDIQHFEALIDQQHSTNT